MKRLIPVILIACIIGTNAFIPQSVHGQVPDGKYYLVRHAEKDTGNDPGLTRAGRLRAGDLYRELKNKMISKIYVSQYLRTQMTSDSLRIYKKIDIIHYKADNSGDGLIHKLSQKKRPGNILIIGHSNTIPAILKRLGVTALDVSEIADNEYDNLFVVTVKNKKVSLKWLKYGKAPLPVTDPGAMKPLQ